MPVICSLLRCRIILMVLLSAMLCGTASAQTFPGDESGTDIGGSLTAGYEPSGLAYNATTGKLWTCHDGGTLTRMNTDGTSLTNWTISGAPDLEGLAIADESSNFIYLGVENPDGIIEYNFNTSTIVRTFDLTGTMTGAANQGLEALEFVPIEGHAEGGLFYAGLQETGEVFIFSLPIVSSSSSTTVTFVSSFQAATDAGVDRADISGLFYQAQGNVLWAIYDTANKIRAMTIDGDLIREFTLPGSAQEGVAVVGSDLYIAEDATKEIFEFANFAPTNITISTTTRAGTSATGTGTAISGRAPLPVVVDVGSGTTTTHATGSAQQVGIRWAERKFTNLVYDHDTGGGAGVDPEIECTDCFTTFSWELNNASTSGGTDWTASTADANEFFHDGGTEVHGKPIGVRISGSDATEGTCCALGAGEWGWCNPSVCDAADANANRVMVRLSDNADPDSKATGTVQVLYGDGEYIELQHSTWNSGDPFFAYVKSKTSDDVIVLAAAPSGADSDEQDVIGYQAVNPWTDLRYEFSVTCPNGGGTCIEDITNGDQRPWVPTSNIDETVGHGPIWAFVFKEGFGANAIISVVAHDDANGDTTDSQTIEVDETAWTGGSAIRYVASTGDDSDGTTLVKAWNQPEDCINWLRTASAGSECVFLAGDTTTVVNSSTAWNGVTGDRRIRSSTAGSQANITVGTGDDLFEANGTNEGIRILDLNISKTGTSPTTGNVMRLNGSNSAFVRNTVAATVVDGISLGTGSNVANDFVIWDCEISCNGNNSSFPLFMGGNATIGSIRRRALVGCDLSLSGAGVETVARVYAANSLFAYNKMTQDGDLSGSKDVLRICAGNSLVTGYNYVFGNYLIATDTETSQVINAISLFADSFGTDTHRDVLIDSNFFFSETTGNIAHRFLSSEVSYNVLVKNNIGGGAFRFINAGNGTKFDWRVFHNSAYSANARQSHFINKGGAGQDWAALKIINNAVNFASSGASSVVIQNNGNVGTIESTQILENVVDFGTVSTTWQVESSNGSFSAWTSTSGKAAQLNYTASNGKDNAPLFALPASNDFRLCTISGSPDASCTGTSPCIDSGHPLPTVYYDYAGVVRNSYDVGAFDDDQAAEATGLCYECDGDCIDDQTEAECIAVGGEWEEDGVCAGDATTGACCGASFAACTATGGVTDYCCSGTWITGGTCGDCTGQCCESDGTCSVVSKTTCDAFTNEEFTWQGSCGTCPTVACCNGISCSDVTEFACDALGFATAGAGTDCGTGSPCADPSGSCCSVGGLCTETVEGACASPSVWLEAGTCSPNICAAAWACCVDEVCTDYTEAYCTTLTGDWYENDGCDVGFCSLGACCDVDSACAVTIESECTADHWFQADDCTTTTCDTGTCCECDDTCTDGIEADCTAFGALFSSGDTCAVEACPASTGGCCHDGICESITSACCTLHSGTYLGNGVACGPTSCGVVPGSLSLMGVGR